ncbi:NAD(P)/FAD-dependent oxidoreductase [Enterovibrio norvegicus]|uniref:NAD(P)/FAD-dependent oxidoreductase n=1 Tax=Enterovibrio norvegicus TaxID=188144 RepID=UPI0035520520
MKNNYDIAVIGGGFFGLYLAYFYAESGKKVVVIERESESMQRASFNNQARVHNGYHYPRSVLTALRSRISFPRFVDEFQTCIDSEFDKYYLIAKRLGKINAIQFKKFCERIGAPCELAKSQISKISNPNLIEATFLTKEFAFDSTLLKEEMLNKLDSRGVDIRYGVSARRVRYLNKHSRLLLQCSSSTNELEVIAKQVFNCTYSGLNQLIKCSGLPMIPLRHELTEMCIVDVPDVLKKAGLTIMCGPFFSVMPFPAIGKHSFSHVRYTPHFDWDEKYDTDINPQDVIEASTKRSAWNKMLLDAQRYIPVLSELSYDRSLWEIKTILPRSDSDDSRPILFMANHGLPGFHCVMGGKIDNIYDVIEVLRTKGLL